MECNRIGVADLHANVGSARGSLEESMKKDMVTMRQDQHEGDVEQDAQAKHYEIQLRQTLETIQRDISTAEKAFSNVSEETVNFADGLKMLRSFGPGICTRPVEWMTGDLSDALEICPISPRRGNGGLAILPVALVLPVLLGFPLLPVLLLLSAPGVVLLAASIGSHPTAFDTNTTMRPSLTTQASTISVRMASPLDAVLSGAELTPGETTEGGYESFVPDPGDAGAVRVFSPQFDAAGLQSLCLQLQIKLRQAQTSSRANEATSSSTAVSSTAVSGAWASTSATSSSAAAATGDGRQTPIVVSDADPAPLEAFCTLLLMGPPGLRIAFKLNLGTTTVQKSHIFDTSSLCPSGCEAMLDEAALRSGNLNVSVELLEGTQSIYSFGQPDRTFVKEVSPMQRPLTGTSRPNSRNSPLTTPAGIAPALTSTIPGPYQQHQQQQQLQQQHLAYGPDLVGPQQPLPSSAEPTRVVHSIFRKHQRGGSGTNWILEQARSSPWVLLNRLPSVFNGIAKGMCHVAYKAFGGKVCSLTYLGNVGELNLVKESDCSLILGCSMDIDGICMARRKRADKLAYAEEHADGISILAQRYIQSGTGWAGNLMIARTGFPFDFGSFLLAVGARVTCTADHKDESEIEDIKQVLHRPHGRPNARAPR